MTLNAQLRQLETNLAPWPLPDTWTTSHPHLADLGTFSALFDALRSYTNRDLADRIVTTLLVLPTARRPAVEPTTVLLVGLRLRLRQQHHNIPIDSYNDLVTELAALLCESGLIDQLAGRTKVCDILTRRAGRRWQRRHATHKRRAAHQAAVDAAAFDSMIGTNQHAEIENAIIDRVALGNLSRRITAGIKRGDTSAIQWDHYINGVLAPALDLPEHNRAHPHQRRINIPRARRNLAGHITKALAA